jgi:hypothetical protein
LSRPHPPNMAFDAESAKRMSRRVDHVCELLARLSGSPIPAFEFFQTLTTKTLAVIHGTAGTVWLKSPQGLLQQVHQTNMAAVGLDDLARGREIHNELLKQALGSKKPFLLDPDTKFQTAQGTEGGNPSAYPLALAPILDDQGGIFGLFEVYLDVDTDPKLRGMQVNFVNQMAGYATNYLRNNTALRNSVQEQIFTQVEAFSKQIHASLNPTEVAFQVVNEGRRIVGCDRMTAGIRHGQHTNIEAVSGSDVVERSSVQVKALGDLFDAVLDWNERLVYQGSRDTTLPPPVLLALDDYLTQSNPKLLVLQPLRDEREFVKEGDKERKTGPSRSALMLESFDPPEVIDTLLERFNLVAGHAGSALYNAAEMKRIPLAFLWKPIMALQGRAGSKRRFYVYLALGAIAIFTLAMILVPYPLKLDAKGQLEPEEWNYIYPTDTGRVMQFKVVPGQVIRPNTPIAVMFDNDLARQINEKLQDISNKVKEVQRLGAEAANAALPPPKRQEKLNEQEREQATLRAYNETLNLLLEQHYADRANPGQYTVFAPEFRPSRQNAGPANWKVLSADFEHQLVNRFMKPSDPLLRVGNTAGAWQIELKIPQKHISQLLRAFRSTDPNEFLDVDVLVTSKATETFKGRLYRRDIFGEAVQNKDDHNESEFIVYAYVKVNDPAAPAEDHIPANLLTTGVEVHTRIRCRNHSLGYSLFHGAWEFVYEHVIFPI